MPYLLSPAGSMESLKAAINAGADEIYLGGSLFNARMNARNFDENSLIEAKKRCEAANVKLHITLNTLIYDKELAKALEYVSFLENKVRPDALIVQDVGIIKKIRENFPSMPLHASTQLRIHSHLDAKYLKDLGFTRAVLARELPKEDIALFAKTGLETEIFVHGALCVSESGGCLMSSVIGGRSGNRGECAQPCRLGCKGINKYPLSLKDSCLAKHLTEIDGMGVTSLKMEGRMKSPEYVGAVTAIYRKILDEKRDATEAEIKTLESVFSRSGFTDGYFVGKINPSMFGIRREEDKESTEKLYFIPPKAEKRVYHANPEVRKETVFTPVTEKILSPAKQKGLVFRFEGKAPCKSLLEKLYPLAARIDIPLRFCGKDYLKPFSDKIALVMPRNIFSSELDDTKKQIENAKKLGISHAVVSALYQAELCKDFYIHGDYALNVFNSESEKFFENYGFSSIMLSPESDGKFVRQSACALEYIGYGRTPLMHTRTCIIKNAEGCKNKELCFGTLVDRTGARFPIISGVDHRNTIYNSLPRFALDKRKEYKKCGVGLITLLFTDESDARIEKIVSLALSDAKPDFEYTRK